MNINPLILSEKKINTNKEKQIKILKGSKNIAVEAVWLSEGSSQQEDFLKNKDLEYEDVIQNYNRQVEAVKHGFNNIPSIRLDFHGTAWLMSLAYDCQMLTIGGRINSEPLYHTITEADKMKKKENIYNFGLYPIITERILEFQENYPEVPISIPDNQSPIDVLTCIVQSEAAMLAMYDKPKKIHRIMNIITDSIVEVNRYYENIINNFAGFQCPIGMHVSDDNAAFLSPSIYQEFAMPYINKLSEGFGGIDFHCCMGFEQNLKNMANIKDFLGFDPQVDFNDIDKIIDAVRDTKGAWRVNNYPWQKKDDREISDEEMFKKVIDLSEGICGLIITVCDSEKDESLKLADRIMNYAVKKGRA